CRALVRLGEFRRAEPKIDEAVAAAERVGSRSLTVQARLEHAALQGWLSAEAGSEPLRRETEGALPVLEQLGDDVALAHAWRHLADVHLTAGRCGACADALEQALRHAAAAGSRAEELSLLSRVPASLYLGAIPTGEAI